MYSKEEKCMNFYTYLVAQRKSTSMVVVGICSVVHLTFALKEEKNILPYKY